MFDELKQAIQDVLSNPSKQNLKLLRNQYNLHFVELEDDVDFKGWQKVCEEGTMDNWEDVCFPT